MGKPYVKWEKYGCHPKLLTHRAAQNQHHPNRCDNGEQPGHGCGNDKNLIQRADRWGSSMRSLPHRRSGTLWSSRRSSSCTRRRHGLSGNRRWYGTWRTGRAAGRKRGQFNCRRGGRFGRQTDANGFFFGLNFAGFFFRRQHNARGSTWNVRRNLGHNVW